MSAGQLPRASAHNPKVVGSLVDVLAYRDRQDAQSRRALDELTAQAEELGLYDEP